MEPLIEFLKVKKDIRIEALFIHQKLNSDKYRMLLSPKGLKLYFNAVSFGSLTELCTFITLMKNIKSLDIFIIHTGDSLSPLQQFREKLLQSENFVRENYHSNCPYTLISSLAMNL